MDVETLLAKASENLSVRRAFGAAYEKDGMLIIPVALVAGGGGGGTSTARTRGGDSAARADGPAADPAGHDAAPQDTGRPDAGGGFGGVVLPSGAYVVKGDQVRWVPAVDATIVALASLSLVRVLVRTWARRRPRRSGPWPGSGPFVARFPQFPVGGTGAGRAHGPVVEPLDLLPLGLRLVSGGQAGRMSVLAEDEAAVAERRGPGEHDGQRQRLAG